MDNKISLICERRHPYFNKYKYGVELSYSAYLNEEFISSSTLHRHLKEGNSFQQRLKRAYNINYYKYLINQYFKEIYNSKNKIERTIPPELKNLEHNIDQKGNSIDDIMKEAGINALIGRQSYILIDAYSQNPSRPYVKVLNFLQVTDWEYDDKGNFEWVIIKYDYYKSKNPFSSREFYSQYLLYTKDYWQYFDDKGSPIKDKSGFNSLGTVPLIKVLMTDINNDGIGEGFVSDLLPIQIEILNTISLYQTELYNLLFNFLSIQGQVPTNENGNVELGEANILQVDTTATQMPKYVTPDTVTLEEKRIYWNYLVDEALRITGFRGQDESIKKNSQSGISKLFDLINTTNVLSYMSMQLEKYERHVWWYLNMFVNDNNSIDTYDNFQKSISIPYERDFIPQSLDSETNNLIKLTELNVGPSTKAKAIEILCNKSIGPYISPKELDSLNRENIRLFIENNK